MKNNRLVRVFVSAVLCMVFLAIPAGSAQAMPFKVAVNYSVGTDPHSVAVGDFDMDGIADLATANEWGGIYVLLGTGSGTFGTAVNYPVGSNAQSVAVADFDGDGIPDIAAANRNSNNVSILLGTGSGTFGSAVNHPVGANPSFIAVADFNRDGKPDLATANYGSDNVSILINNGSGGFPVTSNYTTGAAPLCVAIDDFNRDGKPDLAVANSTSNDVSILLGDGSGGFGMAVNYAVGTSPFSAAVGDFNGDGKLDLATANGGSNNVSILLGDGLGAFSTAVNYAVGNYPCSVYVGDFNRDGIPDLAVANYNDNNISTLLGTGSGTFSTSVNYTVGTNPRCVAMGDFDRDGALDLAVANEGSDDVSILLNKTAVPSVSFNASVNYPAGEQPRSVAVGDFDRDGKLDLAVTKGSAESGAVSRLLGNGRGGFGEPETYAAPTGDHSVAVGDFNRDGKPDMVTANYYGGASAGVSILLGSDNGTFDAALNSAAGANPNFVAVGDFNRDGKPDLAVANDISSNISILLGENLTGFAAAMTYGVGTNPISIAIGDFDRNGWPDLAVANKDSNNVSVLLGDNLTGFTTAVSYGVGTSPYSIAVGDFNRDGKPDLATSNYGSNNVSILLGDNLTGFATAVSYVVGTNPYSIAVGDFNQDGALDLAVSNYNSSNVSILLGIGNGTFTIPAPTNTRAVPLSVAVGDFNRDGRPDLAVSHDISGNISILLNTPLTGNVFTWGSNGYGELGDNTTAASNVPVRVHGAGNSGYLGSVTAIAGGFSHSLAVMSDGSVWAWGRNNFGQLGDGAYDSSSTPVQVVDTSGTGYLTGITSVSARGERSTGVHSLARASDGTVYAWGSNTYGQLGDGSNTSNPLPVQVSGLSGVTAVAAGGYFSLALKSDGTVWAWGNNAYGQLGNNTTSHNNTPVQVHGVGNSGYLTNIIAIAAGQYHSLAVKSDGTVYAWGLNDSGELGNGNNTSSSTPVQVSGLSDAVAVAGGGDSVSGRHSLAVKSDGSVYAWGYNGHGQLGNNTTGDSNVPVQVRGPNNSGYFSGVKSVAAGAWHSVALKTDGTTWAWGNNSYDGGGQLGDSTIIDSSTPVQVTDLSDVVAISAGALDSLALIGSRPFAPTVATDNATHVASTTVWLHGTLTDDGGQPGPYHFRYGTSPGSYTSGTAWSTDNKTTGQTFLNICGLSPGTTYYYVAECKNDAGTGTGFPEKSFTTLSGPTVTTGSATSVMANTAILHGNLGSTGGADTTVIIYSGTVDGGADSGLWQRPNNLGVRPAGPFSLGVMGLTPNTTYYYRCWATNSNGSTWAPDPSVSFTTQANLGLWRNYWAGPGTDWHWFSSGGP